MMKIMTIDDDDVNDDIDDNHDDDDVDDEQEDNEKAAYGGILDYGDDDVVQSSQRSDKAQIWKTLIGQLECVTSYPLTSC